MKEADHPNHNGDQHDPQKPPDETGQPSPGAPGQPEQQPTGGDVFQQRHLSIREEFLRRMQEAGTKDVGAIIDAELQKRYQALREAAPSFEEFVATHKAAYEQGGCWRFRREILGMSIDEVAGQAGISPWELLFIEQGYPQPTGVPEDVAQKLDSLIGKQSRN